MDEEALARMAAARGQVNSPSATRGGAEPRDTRDSRPQQQSTPQQPQTSGRRGNMASNNVDHKVYWGGLFLSARMLLGTVCFWAIVISAAWTAITKQPMQMKQAADGLNPIFWGSNVFGAPAGNTVTNINNQVVTPLNSQIESGAITIVPPPGKQQDIPELQRQQVGR